MAICSVIFKMYSVNYYFLLSALSQYDQIDDTQRSQGTEAKEESDTSLERIEGTFIFFISLQFHRQVSLQTQHKSL